MTGTATGTEIERRIVTGTGAETEAETEIGARNEIEAESGTEAEIETGAETETGIEIEREIGQNPETEILHATETRREVENLLEQGTEMTNTNRHEGKPFVLVLNCFIFNVTFIIFCSCFANSTLLKLRGPGYLCGKMFYRTIHISLELLFNETCNVTKVLKHSLRV